MSQEYVFQKRRRPTVAQQPTALEELARFFVEAGQALIAVGYALYRIGKFIYQLLC